MHFSLISVKFRLSMMADMQRPRANRWKVSVRSILIRKTIYYCHCLRFSQPVAIATLADHSRKTSPLTSSFFPIQSHPHPFASVHLHDLLYGRDCLFTKKHVFSLAPVLEKKCFLVIFRSILCQRQVNWTVAVVEGLTSVCWPLVDDEDWTFFLLLWIVWTCQLRWAAS